MEQQLAIMTESGCLPNDFQTADFSECENQRPRSAKMQCIATSSGFSTSSGFDQTAAEAFIDARSSDEEWRAQQKELLANCASMLMEVTPADKQGVFVKICLAQLMVADCNKQRLVAAAEAVDAENGEEVAEQVAEMAEGACFKKGLKYSEEVKQQWLNCANENSLDLKVLMGAGVYYKLLAMGSNSLPELTAENVTAVAEQLEKLEAAGNCYALASGEASSDGTINYDTIIATIDGAKGKQPVKEAAKKIVEYCQSQEPEDINEFYECYLEAQPFGCVALKSYALLSGRPPRQSSAGRRRRSVTL